MKALRWIALVALLAFAAGSAEDQFGYACATDCEYDSTIELPYPPPTHNDRGGYIDACGDLPGMVGDDC